MAEPGSRLLTMGRICGLFGVRGWVKVHSYTAPAENILRYSPWRVFIGGAWKTLAVSDGRRHGGKGIVARLQGYDDCDAARELVDSEIMVERIQLEAPREHEYYWADLIGSDVVNRDGTQLGQVDHLIETGANDVLVVRGKGETLIPFVMGKYILEVDLAGRRILVDWEAES